MKSGENSWASNLVMESDDLEKSGEKCVALLRLMNKQRRWVSSWARILVKSRGEVRPSVLEIEVEEEVYACHCGGSVDWC
ncbi:hypothetical protein AAG906_017171 [Vitis piasezkii]